MIIGISGHARSGKDTVGTMIATAAVHDDTYPKFEHKKFAGYVKQVASLLTGIPLHYFEVDHIKRSYLPKEWNDQNLIRLVGDVDDARMTIREMLQKIGTDCIRENLHPNAWVNALMKDYKKPATEAIEKTGGYTNHPHPMNFPNWIITDVRFPNEFDAIKERGGILIRVNRDNLAEDVHISEVALDKEKRWDYVIDNNGTLEQLSTKVGEIWKDIRNVQTELSVGSPLAS